MADFRFQAGTLVHITPINKLQGREVPVSATAVFQYSCDDPDVQFVPPESAQTSNPAFTCAVEKTSVTIKGVEDDGGAHGEASHTVEFFAAPLPSFDEFDFTMA